MLILNEQVIKKDKDLRSFRLVVASDPLKNLRSYKAKLKLRYKHLQTKRLQSSCEPCFLCASKLVNFCTDNASHFIAIEGDFYKILDQ